MECREVRELGESFVSEQLLVETTQRLVAHLDRCPACRAEIEGLRRLKTGIRSAFDHATDLKVRPEFAAALRTQLQARAVGTPVRPAHRARWLALAASVLIVVGAGYAWRERSVSRIAALLHDAVGDHQFCALTFKLPEHPIPLAEADRRFGGHSALLESVQPADAALSGGPLRIVERHSCVFEGRRFTHIVMRYKNERLSLLVAADQDGAADLRFPAVGVSDVEGFRVASTHDGPRAMFVVSSLDQSDVQEVARAMFGPVSRALAGA